MKISKDRRYKIENSAFSNFSFLGSEIAEALKPNGIPVDLPDPPESMLNDCTVGAEIDTQRETGESEHYIWYSKNYGGWHKNYGEPEVRDGSRYFTLILIPAEEMTMEYALNLLSVVRGKTVTITK